ncbi:unnamed protein product [Amoebophrya sp. A25]|nr:unnamed protein product [Amoebophrya sp. A25]|eukprot:GSA25T00005368001.1
MLILSKNFRGRCRSSLLFRSCSRSSSKWIALHLLSSVLLASSSWFGCCVAAFRRSARVLELQETTSSNNSSTSELISSSLWDDVFSSLLFCFRDTETPASEASPAPYVVQTIDGPQRVLNSDCPICLVDFGDEEEAPTAWTYHCGHMVCTGCYRALLSAGRDRTFADAMHEFNLEKAREQVMKARLGAHSVSDRCLDDDPQRSYDASSPASSSSHLQLRPRCRSSLSAASTTTGSLQSSSSSGLSGSSTAACSPMSALSPALHATPDPERAPSRWSSFMFPSSTSKTQTAATWTSSQSSTRATGSHDHDVPNAGGELVVHPDERHQRREDEVESPLAPSAATRRGKRGGRNRNRFLSTVPGGDQDEDVTTATAQETQPPFLLQHRNSNAATTSDGRLPRGRQRDSESTASSSPVPADEDFRQPSERQQQHDAYARSVRRLTFFNAASCRPEVRCPLCNKHDVIDEAASASSMETLGVNHDGENLPDSAYPLDCYPTELVLQLLDERHHAEVQAQNQARRESFSGRSSTNGSARQGNYVEGRADADNDRFGPSGQGPNSGGGLWPFSTASDETEVESGSSTDNRSCCSWPSKGRMCGALPCFSCMTRSPFVRE